MRALLTCVAVLSAIALQAQAPVYNRGDEVRVQTSDGKPASPTIQRVIAVPGDRLKIDKTRASVNEQAIADADLSPKLLTTCGKWTETVPVGHYFLAGEEVKAHSAIRSCSLVPASRIIGRVQR
jgi:signal peptidase I